MNTIQYKLTKKAGLAILSLFESVIRTVQLDKPFYDTSDFPWVQEVEENWEGIQKELENLLSSKEEIPNLQDVFEEQKQLTKGDEWKSYMLYFYGYRIGKNASKCPKTEAIVKKIPGMKTAMFSILSGGKQIKPHRGPYKGVLRYHLGLVVPTPYTDCGIRVSTETKSWNEGESLILDDTLEHEAWNNSSENRIILFVDFQRELPRPISWLNEVMFLLIRKSPFIKNVINRLN